MTDVETTPAEEAAARWRVRLGERVAVFHSGVHISGVVRRVTDHHLELAVVDGIEPRLRLVAWSAVDAIEMNDPDAAPQPPSAGPGYLY